MDGLWATKPPRKSSSPREIWRGARATRCARSASMKKRIRLLQRVSDEFQAAMEVFHECESCKEDWIHRRCASCEVMARESLPVTVRMIWLSEPEPKAAEKPDAPPRTPGPIIG